jgi:hypothetical protein
MAPLPIVPIDFNAGLAEQRYYVGVVDAWQLDGLTLTDGMIARFEQRGELDMIGTLHLVDEARGNYWIADVDPATLRYHITRTEFYIQPHEGRLALGSEGTKEGDDCAHLFQGGEAIVLTNGRDAVEAHVHQERWDGKQVWMAIPDWTTYLRYPPAPSSDVVYQREGEQLGWHAGQHARGTPLSDQDTLAQQARERFIALLFDGPPNLSRSLHGSPLNILVQFQTAFARGYRQGWETVD